MALTGVSRRVWSGLAVAGVTRAIDWQRLLLAWLYRFGAFCRWPTESATSDLTPCDGPTESLVGRRCATNQSRCVRNRVSAQCGGRTSTSDDADGGTRAASFAKEAISISVAWRHMMRTVSPEVAPKHIVSENSYCSIGSAPTATLNRQHTCEQHSGATPGVGDDINLYRGVSWPGLTPCSVRGCGFVADPGSTVLGICRIMTHSVYCILGKNVVPGRRTKALKSWPNSATPAAEL